MMLLSVCIRQRRVKTSRGDIMKDKKLNENMTIKGASVNVAKIINVGLIKGK